MKTLCKVIRYLPFLIMGICVAQAALFYARPSEHSASMQAFFAIGAVVMMVVVSLFEVTPWLRHAIGIDSGIKEIDDARWRVYVANGNLALLATQFAGVVLMLFLHLNGQLFTFMVVAALVVFSKVAHTFLGAFQ